MAFFVFEPIPLNLYLSVFSLDLDYFFGFPLIRRILSRAQVRDPFLFTSFYEFMRHFSHQLYFSYAVKKVLVVIVYAKVVVSLVVKLSQGVH